MPEENAVNHEDMENQIDDTPMALLEQLVYMENFLQSAGTSPNANPSQTPDTNGSNSTSNLNFNDQLQRELAAFADDTFIFPDEDKNEGPSSFNQGFNGSHNHNYNSNNDLLSFADATSFNHVSPALSTSTGPPISNQTYQNLNQRYTNKRKFDYHDTMQNNNNTSIGNITTNTNTHNNLPQVQAPVQQQQQQQKLQRQPQQNHNKPISPIPSTIHELLGKGSTTSPQTSSFNPSMLSRASYLLKKPFQQQQQQQQQQRQKNSKVHVPEGAQSTLSAAGLSQTQIDALASLVAFHKPEVYQPQPPTPTQGEQITSGLGANPSIYQTQSLLAHHGRNNSGNSTITASATPLNNMAPQQLQQQQQQQQQSATTTNSLLVNLLAQTLANAVQPNQQNNLLNDLVVALASNQANQLNNQQMSIEQHQQQAPINNDPLLLLQRQMQSPPQFTVSAPVPQQMSPTPVMNNHHSPLAQAPQQHHTPTDEFNTQITKQRKRKSPVVKLEDSPMDSEEEKRQKVTAASARFRQKKKIKEQEMEKSLVEAHKLSASLESRIQQLEMENRLLKNLVVEKSQRRDEEEVERLRKKAKNDANRNKD